MDQLTSEKDKYLATRHEGAHVVTNAAKGRRIDEVRIWLDDQTYHGATHVRIFAHSEPEPEPGHFVGVIGDINNHLDMMKARADEAAAAQQAQIELPLEDELITLAAGIVAEEMSAREKGWSIDNIDEKVQAETDIDYAKEKVRKAGRTMEFDILWQSARFDASQLLCRADIREAWDLITELLIKKEEIKWEDMDEQMIERLTLLRE